jgi:histidyl-tRNA synthetase
MREKTDDRRSSRFQPPRGMQDFLPQEMIRRQYVLDTIRRQFEIFGFDPLETPAVEDWKLLESKGGEAIKEEIYYFKDKSGRELGLRFDVTVPLCRIIASKPDIPKPFRRYVIGRVWRYDRPGAGRKREFWQADADIVGSPSLSADSECVAAACSALEKLKLNFTVRVNNRKWIEAELKKAKVRNLTEIFRIIDKLDKIGIEKLKKELGADADKVTPILESKQAPPDVKEFITKLSSYGYKAVFDPSLVRGLDYYTGLVFEIVSDSKFSIAGGGRYDNIIKQFGGQQTPAVGISLGIERIMELVKLPKPKTLVEVFIATIGNVDVIGLVKELRSKGIRTQLNTKDAGLSAQLKYASSKAIPKVIIAGEKDLANGEITLRDMESGKEEKIKIENVVDKLK